MRVLVTGIGGFVGPFVARALAGQGDVVHGTWTGQRPLAVDVGAAATLLEADLLDVDALDRAFTATSPDHVVHLAGLSHVGDSWTRIADYYRVNLLGTEHVVAAARRAGARVVFASSADVYGPVSESEQPLREDRPVAPATPYALTKAAAERIVLASGGVVVRAFNIVGPGQAAAFALPAFALQLRRILDDGAEPVLRVGNLTARRDFVHPADAGSGFALATAHGEPGGIYNLANGRALTVRVALDALIAASGLAGAVRIEEDPARLRPVDVPLLLGDAARLRALGWQPRHRAEDAIRELWNSTARARSASAPASTP